MTTSQSTRFDLSPDGRRLVVPNPASEDSPAWVTMFPFVDRQTGATESSTFDATPALMSPSQPIPVFWRPRHDEAWIVTFARVIVWRPGIGFTEVPAARVAFPGLIDASGPSPFTSDGDRFFAYGPEGNDPSTQFVRIYLASADDPRGPRLRLNGPGTALNEVRSLAEGQLLIRTWTTLPERGDILVVDPRLGTIRPIATGGTVTAVGAGRALALLRIVERAGSGDLTLLDLATGAHTLLAENVTSVALDPGPNPVAPGAPIAFIVRNRLASPYDGLWLGTLP